MVLADETLDPRMQANATTAKKIFSNLTSTALFQESKFDNIYGTLKAIKYWSSNVQTDATFIITIRDVDDAIVYTSGAITKNTKNILNFTHDNMLMLCGQYKARFTHTTNEEVLANNYQIMPIFK